MPTILQRLETGIQRQSLLRFRKGRELADRPRAAAKSHRERGRREGPPRRAAARRAFATG